MQETSGGFSGSSLPAHKGKRFAAAFIDLFIIPFIIGFVLGFIMVALNFPDILRFIVTILLNVAWLVVRDVVFAPGRMLFKLRLISLTGGNVTVQQALIRNVLLYVPIVLYIGFILEIVMLIAKGERLEDSWAKTRVVEG